VTNAGNLAAGGSLPDRLKKLQSDGLTAFAAADDAVALEAARVRFMGRNGELSVIMGGMRDVGPAERPVVGRLANEVKGALEAAFEERERAFAGPDESGAGRDLSLPGRRAWPGGRHPVTLVIDEICEIFAELGFTRAAGPEIETDWHNFTALGIPLDHPAADMHDTFWLDEHVVLRTHTSPVQARVMIDNEPPIRVVVPGLCYRRDPFDASHAPAFEQIEGLAVDEGIDFVEFRSAIDFFVRRFFGQGTKTRFRASYFPFTEPSAEVDVTCFLCDGSGCAACKGTGWIEIMGSGMVDPVVFEECELDPERYTGYAFGMGPARIAMLRYRIPDIRLLYEADVRFLEQFL
jgi:phenylalanyl-tRNA synthetase alpha chain